VHVLPRFAAVADENRRLAAVSPPRVLGSLTTV
jgi:hypothetical protein